MNLRHVGTIKVGSLELDAYEDEKGESYVRSPEGEILSLRGFRTITGYNTGKKKERGGYPLPEELRALADMVKGVEETPFVEASSEEQEARLKEFFNKAFRFGQQRDQSFNSKKK